MWASPFLSPFHGKPRTARLQIAETVGNLSWKEENITFLKDENGSGNGQWMKTTCVKFCFLSTFSLCYSPFTSTILSFLLLLPWYPTLTSPWEVQYKEWREPVLLTIIFRRQAPWGSSKFSPMCLYHLFEYEKAYLDSFTYVYYLT